MSKAFDRYQKRKLISSYFSVVLSIALVLFLLGILGLLVINTNKLANHFKEQITISVFLKDNAKQIEIDQLQKSLALAPYTKKAIFVSKADAAEAHSEEIGENFMEFLGYNPLKDGIDLSLKAAYINNDSLEVIASNLKKKAYISEISYDKPLIDLLNDNIKKISLGILIASIVFTIIAVLLINSSIRLSIYSKRFIIKTMQMVGATKQFIRKPFIWKNIKLGLTGALVAIVGLAAVVYYINEQLPELGLLQDILNLVIVFVGVLVLGILISGLSTYFATQRFLNLRTDDLYY